MILCHAHLMRFVNRFYALADAHGSMGRITAFNTRVRTRYSDATNVSAAPAFQMLDDTITAFIQNIPKDRRSTSLEGKSFSLGVSALALPHV